VYIYVCMYRYVCVCVCVCVCMCECTHVHVHIMGSQRSWQYTLHSLEMRQCGVRLECVKNAAHGMSGGSDVFFIVVDSHTAARGLRVTPTVKTLDEENLSDERPQKGEYRSSICFRKKTKERRASLTTAMSVLCLHEEHRRAPRRSWHRFGDSSCSQ
jgi:hypothetical protein